MIDPDSINNEVFEFFFVFSRFEFALKEAGYLKAMNRFSDNAAPDWGAFVKKYKDQYRGDEESADAINYLLSKPPQKQKVLDDIGSIRTIWEACHIDNNAPLLKTLVDIVQTIRNNLFHGGKYGEKGWDDEDRV